MNPTDILLSIAIVGIYTLIYVYLKSKKKKKFFIYSQHGTMQMVFLLLLIS